MGQVQSHGQSTISVHRRRVEQERAERQAQQEAAERLAQQEQAAQRERQQQHAQLVRDEERRALLELNLGICRRFVEEQCVRGPELYVEFREFAMRLNRMMHLDRPFFTSFSPEVCGRLCIPPASWWSEEYELKMPEFDFQTYFIRGIALRKSCVECAALRDRADRLEERVQDLEARLAEMYYAPGAPGYDAAQADFRRLAENEN